MVSRKRRLGKYAPVRFADPPWNEDHPDWIRFDEWLSRDHWVRQIVEAMQVLDLAPLFASYSAGGKKLLRPDLMLRVVVIETQQGRYRPCQWFRDLRENITLMWAAFGIRPSRTYCYEFADRVAPFLAVWNSQILAECQRRKMTPAKRGAQDGTLVAANASRHRLLNEARLTKRRTELEAACAVDARIEPVAATPQWMARTPHGRLAQRQRYEAAAIRLTELQAIARRQPSTCRRAAEKIVVCTSDPQATPGRDKLKVFRPLYNVQLVRDLDSLFILGYEVFAQTNDNGTLKPMLRRLQGPFGIFVETLLADAGYIKATNLALSQRQDIKLCGPWKEQDPTQSRRLKKAEASPKYLKEKFTWLPLQNAYQCPGGHRLTAIGKERRQQSDGDVNLVYRYRCLPEHCRSCSLRDACTSNPERGRSLRRSEHEELIDAHKAYMQTDDAKKLYKLRCQTIELGFADAREHRNLQRFSGRGIERARRQVGLTVLAHNLVTLARSPP
jgi:hypothetical protein